MDFRTLLKTKEFVILDGAMGTMLQAKGLEMVCSNPSSLISVQASGKL